MSIVRNAGLGDADVKWVLDSFARDQKASPLLGRKVLLSVIQRLADIGFHDLSGLSISNLRYFMGVEFKRLGLARFLVIGGGQGVRTCEYSSLAQERAMVRRREAIEYQRAFAERVTKGASVFNDNDPDARGAGWKFFHPIRAASRSAARGALALQRAKEKRDG